MWNTVLFDLDGTLTESGTGIKKSFCYALEKMGRPLLTEEQLDAVIGPPLKDSFRELAGLNEEECDQAISLYRERYTTTGIYENALYPGLLTALETLKTNGLTLAVASSKPEVMVRRILSYFNIDRFFSVIVGSNLDGTRSKKKAVIDEALRRLGLSSDRSGVVYVGDRKYDVIGARECGLTSIGVTYGYGTFEELSAVRPYLIAASPAQMAQLILEENSLTGRGDAFRAASGQPGMAGPAGTRTNQVPPARAGAERPYVARKESAVHKIWRVLYPIVLYLFISNALSFVLAFLMMVILAATSTSGYYDMTDVLTNHAMTLQGIAAAVTIPFLVFFMRQDKKRRLIRNEDKAFLDVMSLKPFFVVLAVVLFVAAGSGFGYLIDLTGIPQYDSQFQQFNDIAYTDPLLLQIIAIGVVGPAAEEMIFRGLVYRRIRDYTNVVTAVILSSVLFGVFHMNLTQGLFATSLGVLLALIYEKTGRFILPVIGHMSNNLMSVLAINVFGADSFVNSAAFNLICLGVTIGLIVVVFVLGKPPVGEKMPEKSGKSCL